MTTLTPDYNAAWQSQPQALFTVDQDQFGKTIYSTVGATAALVTADSVESSGSSISINGTGIIAVTADQTYLITARTDVLNITTVNTAPALIQLFNIDTNESIGAPVPVGATLTTVYTPVGADANLSVIATAPVGTEWAYPAQLVNSAITVQVIGGYTV
jgi:hypothetical protein